MVFLDWKELPWHWALSDSFIATLLLIVLVPGLVAFVFGYFAFRSRIKGVYFSIITQALTFAALLLFFRNETGIGGNNGFTDFKRILGLPIATQGMRMTLFVLTGLTLLGFYVFARWLVASKFGRVLQAVRDAESRVMFCGYNPLPYKLTIWTISAVMCGMAGALYVPQVGIINPGEMSTANSIEIAVWAAVGGRATLVGPIIGAFIVNGAKSWLTVAFPEFWLYFLGVLFIAVTLWMPQGVVGLVKKFKKEEQGMTPDLMEAGAQRYENVAAAAVLGKTESGGRSAGYRPCGEGRRGGHHPRPHPVPRRCARVLRRFQSHQRPEPGHRARRTALHHRPQRRRQDHDDGHHHRQDPARLVARCSSAAPSTCCATASPKSPRWASAASSRSPRCLNSCRVFENLELALATDKRVRHSMVFSLTGEEKDRLAEVLTTIHLADSARRQAGLLSHGQKQWLEIGMLLMQDPKLLLLDEPVAGMTDEETERTAELFLSLKGKHSLMVVEHDMSFIRAISEKVTVLV